MREPWWIHKQRAIEAAKAVEMERQRKEWWDETLTPAPSSVESAEAIALTELDHRILGIMRVKW